MTYDQYVAQLGAVRCSRTGSSESFILFDDRQTSAGDVKVLEMPGVQFTDGRM